MLLNLSIIKKSAAVAAASLLGAGAMALPVGAASAFTNGSFENGTDPGVFTTLTAPDSTTMQGWTVSSGTVDYIGSYWQPSDGSRSLDLSGNGPGAVSQTFNTVAGHTYTVTFDLAGNPDGGPTVKTLTVDTGGGAQPYSLDNTGATLTNMKWTPESYFFTAAGPTTTLTFTSTTATPYGPALDNVVLTDVLTNKNQCKNGGWMAYTDPSFKNQGQCVAYFNMQVKNKTDVTNNNNVNVTNNNSQTATTGRAVVRNNSTGGSATSGDATNSNSTTNTVTVSNNVSF